jgi:hypothetical protein
MNLRSVITKVLSVAILAGCATTHSLRPTTRELDNRLERGDEITIYFKDGAKRHLVFDHVTDTELITQKHRFPLDSISEITYDTEDQNVRNFFRGFRAVRSL